MNNKLFFLIMAVVGTVVPWYFFGSFIAENGMFLGDFIAAAMINGAAAGGMTDLVLSSIVFWVWSYGDARRHNVRGWWMLIPLNLLIGLSLALPLYLVMRINAQSDGKAQTT